MFKGLHHSHEGLAYLIFVAALINLVLALAPNKKAKIMAVLHNVVLWGGRLNLLFGIGLIVHLAPRMDTFLSYWWAWSALILWGPVEVLAKKKIKPDLQYLRDGGQSSKNLLIGTGGQLLLVAVIFGMMQGHGG